MGTAGQAVFVLAGRAFFSDSSRALVLRSFVRGGVLGGLISASITLETISPSVLSVEDMAEEESVVVWTELANDKVDSNTGRVIS